MKIVSCITFSIFLCITVRAQEMLPIKANPTEENITITGDTPFTKAMEIFGNAFKRFTQKPLVYESTETSENKGADRGAGAIGINIPNMYWRDAFDLVLRFNKHWYFETPDYVRVYAVGGSLDTTKVVKAIQTKEVEISAVFFEANRTALDQLGIDWTALWNGKNAISRLNAVNAGLDPTGSGAAATGETPTTSSGSSGGSGSSSGSASNGSIDYGEKFGLKVLSGNLDLVATLKALQAENLGELISCPSVTVRSGEAGRIMVGQDFSIKQRDFSGNTVEKFYSAGTIIDVEPVIMTADSLEFVEMKLTAERSSVFPDPISTIINKTQATTSIVLIDGEETVVGGLFTTDRSNIRRGVPFLRDLPWWFFGLRYLFGYEEEQLTKKELIIIMKAKIIKSVQDRVQAKITEIKQGQQKALQYESMRQQSSREELLQQIEAARKK